MLDEGPGRSGEGASPFSSDTEKLILGNVIGNVGQMWGRRLWLFKLNITNCTLYTAHFILHIAHYRLYISHCILHTENVLCTLNCKMYTQNTLLAPWVKALHSNDVYIHPSYFTAQHYQTLHYTALPNTSLVCTTQHFTSLHYPSLHYTSFQYLTLHFTSVPNTTLHFST